MKNENVLTRIKKYKNDEIKQKIRKFFINFINLFFMFFMLFFIFLCRIFYKDVARAFDWLYSFMIGN